MTTYYPAGTKTEGPRKRPKNHGQSRYRNAKNKNKKTPKKGHTSTTKKRRRQVEVMETQKGVAGNTVDLLDMNLTAYAGFRPRLDDSFKIG